MGFFDSIGSIFNPSNLMGNSGNSLLDLMDPGNTFHTGKSSRLADQQFAMEYDIAKKNYNEQVRMNNENIRMAQEAYNYQKDLNRLQMEREDTATARRVADLKASGLSPTLAAGSAASAAPMRAGSAPQGVAPQMGTPSDVKVQAAMFKESLMKDRMQLATTLMGNIANIARTRAEVELMNAQANQINTMTPIEFQLKFQLHQFNEEMNPLKIKHQVNSISLQEKEMDIKDFDLILSADEHAMNAYRMTKLELESSLIRANIDLVDREYLLKGLAIDMAAMQNERYQLETDEYKKLQDYMHNSLGLPIGAPTSGMSGLPVILGGTASVLWNGIKSVVGSAGHKTGDFVSRQVNRIASAASNVKRIFNSSNSYDSHRDFDRY